MWGGNLLTLFLQLQQMDKGKDGLIWRTEEDKKTTHIFIIKDQKGTAKHKPTGVVVETKPLVISKRYVNQAWHIGNLQNLRNIGEIDLSLIENGRSERINLPKPMLDRLRDYLARKVDITEKYDCADFAHELNGVEYEHANYDPEKWEYINYYSILKPGDTILMKKSSDTNPKNFDHFAIYLDDGLFLSKHGNIGPLIVTGLEEMKTLFESDSVFQIRPKTQFVTK